eukprot:scaffold159306_cov41-Tisochrysis_lutea.AAC.1
MAMAAALSSGTQAIKQRRPPSPSLQVQVVLIFHVNMYRPGTIAVTRAAERRESDAIDRALFATEAAQRTTDSYHFHPGTRGLE